MRILIAGTSYYPAMHGQATFTKNLTEGLARMGHEVISIYPSEKGKSYSSTRANVRLEAIKSTSLTKIHPDSYLPIFIHQAILNIIQSFNPEIVHIQDHYPLSQEVVKVARKNDLPLMGTNHFMPENLAPYFPAFANHNPIYERLMWSWMINLYNRLDVATAQSKASADLMLVNGLKIPVLPVSCGIDLEKFYPDPSVDRAAVRSKYGLDPNRVLFIYVGRLDHEKSINLLVHALKVLNRPEIQVAICGSGTAKASLEELVINLGLSAQVILPGFIPAADLRDLLNSADIFIMPSAAELLSIATLEAMACGRPVILANAVALPELATDGVNGYLFQPGSAEDAARCMELMLDHPEKWESMRAESLRKAEFHGLDNILKQYEVIYNDLLAGEYKKHQPMKKVF